jgi:hypothetical protein
MSEGGEEDPKEDEVVVCLGGMFGDAYLVQSKVDLERDCSITASVTKLQKEDSSHVVELCNLDYEPSSDLALVSLAGEDRALQVSIETLAFLCTPSINPLTLLLVLI